MMNIRMMTVLSVILFASTSFARGDFNSMIENSNKEGQALQKSVTRAVSNDKSFDADVVTAKRVRAYNPVSYNPMAPSDGDVEVIVHRDETKE
jgi:hypothetical protein